MEVIDYKCPACSAPLTYKPETESWKCEYCFNNYRLEDLQKNEKDFENLNDDKTIDVDEYTCSNCGAKIITDENTTATFCVYCGNTAIIKNRLVNILKPDKIIPFKTTKEQAIQAFFNSKIGKLFSPNDFGLKEQVEKVQGIYIPFWLYTGTAQSKFVIIKNKLIKTSRICECNFYRLPVDAATKFDDNIMDSIEPFDYNEIKDFSVSYLSGFLAEKYDLDNTVVYNRAKFRISNDIRDFLIRKEGKGVKTTGKVSIENGNVNYIDTTSYTYLKIVDENCKIDIKHSEYVLLPVWLLNINFSGKKYVFAMNGQTGKIIGNVPIAKDKVIAVAGICSLFFIGVCILLPILGLIETDLLTYFHTSSLIAIIFWISMTVAIVLGLLSNHNNIAKATSAKRYINNIRYIQNDNK